jgi:hypothetical protein
MVTGFLSLTRTGCDQAIEQLQLQERLLGRRLNLQTDPQLLAEYLQVVDQLERLARLRAYAMIQEEVSHGA